MNPEEKAKGIIVEGVKHSLPLNAKSMEELEIQIKDCLADIPKTNDLSLVIKDMVKENLDLCCKPIRINFITRNAYAMYKGIKIPTKGLYNQSKNKFTSKIIKKVLPNHMNVSLSKDLKDKYCFNVDMTFKMAE